MHTHISPPLHPHTEEEDRIPVTPTAHTPPGHISNLNYQSIWTTLIYLYPNNPHLSIPLSHLNSVLKVRSMSLKSGNTYSWLDFTGYNYTKLHKYVKMVALENKVNIFLEYSKCFPEMTVRSMRKKQQPVTIRIDDLIWLWQSFLSLQLKRKVCSFFSTFVKDELIRSDQMHISQFCHIFIDILIKNTFSSCSCGRFSF